MASNRRLNQFAIQLNPDPLKQTLDVLITYQFYPYSGAYHAFMVHLGPRYHAEVAGALTQDPGILYRVPDLNVA